MSFRPKLIASDLDGTIVAHYGEITERTINAFRTAHDMGVEVFFVTGRPPRWMGDVREAFDFGSAICCNGGLIYDLHNDKVLEQWMIQPTELQKAVDILRLTIPNVSFAVESNDHFHREKAYIPRWDIGMDNVGVDNIDTVTNRPALKLLARLSQQEISADEMLIQMLELFDSSDIVIGAAAVADYKSEEIKSEKFKKKAKDWNLKLVKNPDILSWASEHRNGQQKVVGFALETNNATEYALDKLARKKLDFIVLNEFVKDVRFKKQ